MVRVILFVFLILFISGVSYAGDDTTWNDNFLSNALSDVFTKVNKVASGDDPIFSKDAKGADNLLTQGHLDDRNALGTRRPDVTSKSGETSKPDNPL